MRTGRHPAGPGRRAGVAWGVDTRAPEVHRAGLGIGALHPAGRAPGDLHPVDGPRQGIAVEVTAGLTAAALRVGQVELEVRVAHQRERDVAVDGEERPAGGVEAHPVLDRAVAVDAGAAGRQRGRAPAVSGAGRRGGHQAGERTQFAGELTPQGGRGARVAGEGDDHPGEGVDAQVAGGSLGVAVVAAPPAVLAPEEGRAGPPAVGQRARARAGGRAAHRLGRGGRQCGGVTGERPAEGQQVQCAGQQGAGRGLDGGEVLPDGHQAAGGGVAGVTGGDGPVGRGVLEEVGAYAQRLEQQGPYRLPPGHAGDLLDQTAGGHIAGVGVGEAAARREQQVARGADRGQEPRRGESGGGVGVRPGRQPGGVAEQVTHGHLGYRA